MCWSPKVSTPKVDTNKARAVEPAPLTAEPTGVQFGNTEDNAVDNGETTGKESVTVETPSVPKEKPVEKSTTSTAKRTSVRGAIRK